MFRNLGFSGLANFSRLLANGFLFIGLAAFWPPELFGRFVFHNVVAVVAALAVDYGLSISTMRDVARSPNAARPILLAALRGQLWLVPVSALVGILLWYFGIATHPELLVPLWLAHVLFSFVNTGYGAFRGVGRFDAEAHVALFGNALFFSLPIAVAWMGGSLVAVAVAMVLARLGQAFACAARARMLPVSAALSSAPKHVLRGARAYALESWSSALFQHADSLLVRLLLGEVALGVYQAGARFLVVAAFLVQSLGNSLVPSLTAALSDAAGFRRALRQSTAAFSAIGVICLLGLGLLGVPVVRLVYGDAYAGAAVLMPFFGLVALLRCIAAGQGFALLALGRQAYRLQAVLAALAVFVPAGLVGAGFGLSGVIWANALAVAVLLAFYWWRVRDAMPSAAGAQS